MGPRSTGETKVDTAGDFDGGDRGVDVVFRVEGNERFLGRCVAAVVVAQVKGGLGHIKRLVIYVDNGPNNSGRRRQFLKRLIEFTDWSGLEIRLVYYPPYHSKYNPIERCW